MSEWAKKIFKLKWEGQAWVWQIGITWKEYFKTNVEKSPLPPPPPTKCPENLERSAGLKPYGTDRRDDPVPYGSRPFPRGDGGGGVHNIWLLGRLINTLFKGEVRRKMNFTFVLGFVVLKDVVKVFPVSSSSFARKTTGRNRARSHSGAWRGLKTKSDLKLSLPSPIYLIRYLFIEVGTTIPKLKLDAFQLWQLRSLKFPVILGSKWDPVTNVWRQGGASPERLAELPTGVFPLQKRIWQWDFYHSSSCNFFFHICFCHLWRELPL